MGQRGWTLAWILAAAGAAAQNAAPDGNALLAAGQFAQARDAFEGTLAADSSNAQAQIGEVSASEHIALDQRASGHLPDALATLLRAQKFAPQAARLDYDIGILEDEMQLYPDAQKSLAAAEQLHYEDPALLYAEARVLLDEQQLEPAKEKMTEYLKLRPNDATAHYGLGRIEQMGLHFDEARAEFEESIRLQPQQTEGWYQLGAIALEQNQFDEALADFGKALGRDSKHGGALAGSGQACYRLKRYAEALQWLDRAVAAAPDYQPAHYYRGLTLARLGRKEESEQELAEAAKLADAQNKKDRTRYQLSVPPGG
ncbi:MAG TPA: tetratricopeptide repeat protein [Acidobacteriaceae bacterium]|nr:tetratricopeptide repeat protein [Acidobacteriaceae bacterium]